VTNIDETITGFNENETSSFKITFFVDEGSLYGKVNANNVEYEKFSIKEPVLSDDVYNPHIYSNLWDRFPVTVTDMTFKSGVVPEPSTYAFILGALTLGLVAYKRRK